MKLLTAEQIRQLDKATIANEPISSTDLMERAALQCSNWIFQNYPTSQFAIFCGIGNNGGDGLCVARHLLAKGKKVDIYILGEVASASADFRFNLNLLKVLGKGSIYMLDEESHLFQISHKRVVVDAIFGTGLSRPIDGWLAEVIDDINELSNTVVAIDTPSGMNVDLLSPSSGTMVQADHTLTFQMPKLAYLFAENAGICGRVAILDIGLDAVAHEKMSSALFLTTMKSAKNLVRRSQVFAHKGQQGHLLLVAGSMGKMGAAALSAEAGLRAGVGLLTAHIPQIGYNSMQYGVPEVMVNVDSEADMISSFAVSENHSAVAIGPGIGQDPVTCKTLLNFLTTNTKPLVLDADALNILSNDRHYLFKLHKQTVLTPHPREFDRLFGEHDTSFERFRTLQLKAQELGVVIVLKGAYTRVALPDGTVHFNGSGNPGMATAGSGDVLTGIIGGLLAQGYPADVAARLGVFLHGLSADLLLEHSGPQGITAGDIVRNLGVAWKKLAG